MALIFEMSFLMSDNGMFYILTNSLVGRQNIFLPKLGLYKLLHEYHITSFFLSKRFTTKLTMIVFFFLYNRDLFTATILIA